MAWSEFFNLIKPLINSFLYMVNTVIGIFFRITVFDVPIILYPLFFGFLIFVIKAILGVDDIDD